MVFLFTNFQMLYNIPWIKYAELDKGINHKYLSYSFLRKRCDYLIVNARSCKIIFTTTCFVLSRDYIGQKIKCPKH